MKQGALSNYRAENKILSFHHLYGLIVFGVFLMTIKEDLLV